MITVPNYKVLETLPNAPADGEYAVCEDTRKVYCYKNDTWEEFDGKGKLDLNLYELNKTVMAQLPKHDFKQRLEDINKVRECLSHAGYISKYYMLLGRDLNYYTMFAIQKFDFVGETLSTELMACLDNIGEIVSFDFADDAHSALEIWVRAKSDKQAYCLMFFDYTDGVIEVRKDG